MFVTTAIVGVSARKERSYSSASTTNRSVAARRAGCLPSSPTRAADEPGRIEPAARERLGGHHGRRRLAVRARDADQRRARRRLAQRLGAPDDREAELARADQLRMVLRHRRRDDQRARAVDVRGSRAGLDERRRARRGRRAFSGCCVAAGDADAAEDEELGEGAHPGAGDADEMDGPRVGGVEEAGHDGGEYRAPRRARSRAKLLEVEHALSIRRAMVSAASGRARAEAPAASVEPSPAGSSSRRANRRVEPVHRELATAADGPPHPRRPSVAGVVRLVIGRRRRQRNEDRPEFPTRTARPSSSRRRAPARGRRRRRRRRSARDTRARAHVRRRATRTRAKLALPVIQIRYRSSGMPAPHPLGDDAVHRAASPGCRRRSAARGRRSAGSPTPRAPQRGRDAATAAARSARRCR